MFPEATKAQRRWLTPTGYAFGRCEGSSFLKPMQHFQTLARSKLAGGRRALRHFAVLNKASLRRLERTTQPILLAFTPLASRWAFGKCAYSPLQFYLPLRTEDHARDLLKLKTCWRVIAKAREVRQSHRPRYRKMISNDPSLFSRDRMRGVHFRVDFLGRSVDSNVVSSIISGDP